MSAKTEEAVEEVEHTEPDNVNVGLIATITLVGTFLVVAIAAALTALVRAEAASYSDRVGGYANLGEVSRLKTEQQRKLHTDYEWADQGKGLVRLPIDRAMDLQVADLKRNPALATPMMPESADAGAETADDAGAGDGGAPESAEPAPEGTLPTETEPAPAPQAPAPGAVPGPGAPGTSASPGTAPKAPAPAPRAPAAPAAPGAPKPENNAPNKGPAAGNGARPPTAPPAPTSAPAPAP